MLIHRYHYLSRLHLLVALPVWLMWAWMTTKSSEENTPLDVSTLSQIENLPVTAQMIQRETRRDPTLSQVYIATLNGWTVPQKSQFPQFY